MVDPACGLTKSTGPRPCRHSWVVTLENSPSKVPAADQPFSHFFSAEAVSSAVSLACPAPLTTKEAPGSVWKVAPTARSGL